MRAALTQALEMEGYQVFEVENGHQALESLPEISPDLILSDINMPTLNGIEFYRKLRQIPRWTSVPFIFLTANDSKQDIRAGRSLGVEDYLVKPVDIDLLLSIVSARLLRAAEIKLALIGRAYLDTVTVIANTVERRDPYTRGHIDRVARYARWLAEEQDWTEERLQILEFGARMHDIGKILIPDHILNKTTALTDDEWMIMRQHPEAGAKIIESIDHLKPAVPYVLYHHELWNGSGYPSGLAGLEIPLEGRMMAIVDVFDALTTERPYHPARPVPTVVRYLLFNAGKFFDPDLVPLFMRALCRQGLLAPEEIPQAETELSIAF